MSRRIVSRLAVISLVVAGAVTCSDSPAAVRRAPVRLAFAPRFSSQAATIYRSLAAFQLSLDNVRVLVAAAPVDGITDVSPTVLVDTTVAFPAEQSQITIGIDLTLQNAQQTVVATIELRAGDTPYFAGSQTFVVKQGDTTSAPEPVELSYVGPGATAAFVSISPNSPTLAPSASFQFNAHVIDQSEQTVTDLPLSWSTSDATIASVSPTGLVTSTTKRGSATLTVTGLNGITQQTTITVAPVASLAVLTGANQSGIAGSTLPVAFEVQAVDSIQRPVIGAPITFAAVNGAGGVSPGSVTTDANGDASTALTLGAAAGSYTFTAASGGTVLARIVSTATAAAAASLGIVSGNQQTDTVLATLGQPLTVRATDSFGNPAANQTIDFRVTSGQAEVLAAASQAPLPEVQVTTRTDGTASVSLVAGAVAGAVRVTASMPGTSVASVSFDETLRAGTPDLLVMVQQPPPTAQATVTLGSQPAVRITDAYGNAVALAGVPVVASPTVDCGASACARVVAPRPGSALSSRAPTVNTGAARYIAPQRRSLTAPTASRIAVPTKIAMTQSVSDTFPRGLGGTTRAVTDANGVASFSNLSLNLSTGTWQLVFTDTTGKVPGAALSSAIVLSPGPAESIVAWSGDTTYNVLPGDTLHPSVRVIDKVGNGIPGVAVTWSVNDNVSKLDSLGTTTHTDANGIASPGNWYTPVGVVVNQLEIIATPGVSNLENAPLHLYGVPSPTIGAARHDRGAIWAAIARTSVFRRRPS